MGLFDWLKPRDQAGKQPGSWKSPVKKPGPVKKPSCKAISIDQLRPEITSHYRTAWKPVVEKGQGSPGESRFGGLPGMLEGETWPACGGCGKPMAFFVQVNLGDAPGGFGEGLLQLFYCLRYGDDCDALDFGFKSKNQLVRVIPAKHAGPCGNAALKDDFPAKRIVRWEEFKELPQWEEFSDLGVDLSEAEEKALCDSEFPKSGDKLGGWAAWVQGASYPKCPTCDQTMRVVFQLDSEDNVPYMWGDVGCGHITQCPDHPDVVTYEWACC
jgi:uncharacterized protein YwqG